MAIVHSRFALALVLAVAVSGCAMHKTKPEKAGPDYAQVMQQALSRYAAGDSSGAKKLYHEAADLDPTQADPWYQLARINFNDNDYGRAIIGAREALNRNPTEEGAQSLLTVSGLRVAIEALSNLHDEAGMSGPAHVEAEKLAAKMRDVLGQNVLVPPKQQPKPRYRRRTVRHRAAPKPKVATPSVPQTPKPAKSTPQGSAPANPFLALPGNHKGD